MAVYHRVLDPAQYGIIDVTTRCTKGGGKLDGGRRMPGAGLAADHPGRHRLESQPSSRTGENPPYGMIGGIEETSASFEARSAPRSYPTLSIEELEHRYRACEDACSARHYQTIWLLAQGHTVSEVAALTSFVPRWIEELQARYNALGPQALGDLRRNNGTRPSVLKPELLDELKVRL